MYMLRGGNSRKLSTAESPTSASPNTYPFRKVQHRIFFRPFSKIEKGFDWNPSQMLAENSLPVTGPSLFTEAAPGCPGQPAGQTGRQGLLVGLSAPFTARSSTATTGAVARKMEVDGPRAAKRQCHWPLGDRTSRPRFLATILGRGRSIRSKNPPKRRGKKKSKGAVCHFVSL